MKPKDGDIIVIEKCRYYSRKGSACSICLNHTVTVRYDDETPFEKIGKIPFRLCNGDKCFLNIYMGEKFRNATDREKFLYYAYGKFDTKDIKMSERKT